MFRISKLTDYGTVVMTYLAREPEGLHTAKDITQHTQIALPTVTKLLKIMTRNQLLHSVRGANGGYRLARPADEISVAAILEAIEGEIALTECSMNESHCFLESQCNTRQNWRYISQVIYNALQNISLTQMTEGLSSLNFSLGVDNKENLSTNVVKHNQERNHDS